MIVDGKQIAQAITDRLKKTLTTNGDRQYAVAFIQLGNDPASTSFIKRKITQATILGIDTKVFHYPDETLTTAEAQQYVQAIAQQDYAGIVVQLPLPEPLRDATQTILDCIPQEKDIDALRHDTTRTAPVAQAVQEIFSYHNITLHNKKIVVLGDGQLVGRPVYRFFIHTITEQTITDTTVQQFDHTSDKEAVLAAIRQADIIVTGIGQPHFITPTMINDGVILIDAGTSEQQAKILGDCDPACANKAALFSTTPGGIGPITVACLFAGLVE